MSYPGYAMWYYYNCGLPGTSTRYWIFNLGMLGGTSAQKQLFILLPKSCKSYNNSGFWLIYLHSELIKNLQLLWLDFKSSSLVWWIWEIPAQTPGQGFPPQAKKLQTSKPKNGPSSKFFFEGSSKSTLGIRWTVVARIQHYHSLWWHWNDRCVSYTIIFIIF